MTTNTRNLTFACLLLSSLTLAACRTNDDPMAESSGDGDGDSAGEPCEPADDPVDESSCVALDTDYRPADSAPDMYPACISDGGVYELIADPPGSIARVGAHQTIAELLWRSGAAPTAADFTAARTLYELDEGLGSRVDRREDLHYPPIPMAEWDPGLDPDKQCANSTNAANHPERCVGPAQLRPLINGAFIAGMSGAGDPNVHAARINAGLRWFSYLSVYKEAYTCVHTAKDCDSAWAYYAGGAQVDGALIGFAQDVARQSPTTHQRIFDGILAVRCFRDLYSNNDFPTYDALPSEGQQLFEAALQQLDAALARGFALGLRAQLLAHDGDQCAEALHANWAFIEIVGRALDREVRERDAGAADELLAIYELDAPTSADLDRAVALIDLVIPCA